MAAVVYLDYELNNQNRHSAPSIHFPMLSLHSKRKKTGHNGR